jgi:Na+-translocating ferredoxin:NAD+ oxidoreductase subunit B
VTASLAERIDAALPQTQCTRCGWPDCRAYALAIVDGQAEINQCPPGGAEGVARLAAITGRPAMALNPAHGAEGPRQRMFVDEAWCIGCTLCIEACPVDCIVGAPKKMHVVIEDLCTGCELCLPACPVDCIRIEDATPQRTGWAAWTPALAEQARARYAAHRERTQRQQRDAQAPPAAAAPQSKSAVIDAALQRARERAAKASS